MNVLFRNAVDVDTPVFLPQQREANAPYRHRPNGPSGAFSDTGEGTRTMMATSSHASRRRKEFIAWRQG